MKAAQLNFTTPQMSKYYLILDTLKKNLAT